MSSPTNMEEFKGIRSPWVFEKTDPITDDYEVGDTIGQRGQYGVARRAVRKSDKKVFAVKYINKAQYRLASSKKTDHFAALRSEVGVMRKVKHPNVVEFIAVYEDLENIMIVMEYCGGGELFDKITEQTDGFSEKEAQQIAVQMFRAMNYLHKQRIAHCDLKPDNFLFGCSEEKGKLGPVKVIDFGFSKEVDRGKYLKPLVGTPYYIAPEVIRGQYTMACDMWSMGVVLYVMLVGFPPFWADENRHKGKTNRRIMKLILRGFKPIVRKGYGPFFPADIPLSDGVRDLIARLLVSDPAKRLTACEALEHPWLVGKDLSTEALQSKALKNLKGFVGVCRIREQVINHVTDHFENDKDMKALVASFMEFDKNGDGEISVKELRDAVESHEGDKKEQDLAKQLDALMTAADLDGSGTLSYREVLAVSVHAHMLRKEERLHKLFLSIDSNQDGTLCEEEIGNVMGSKELGDLFKQTDTNKDGRIDYDEFLQLWGENEEAKLLEGIGLDATDKLTTLTDEDLQDAYEEDESFMDEQAMVE